MNKATRVEPSRSAQATEILGKRLLACSGDVTQLVERSLLACHDAVPREQDRWLAVSRVTQAATAALGARLEFGDSGPGRSAAEQAVALLAQIARDRIASLSELTKAALCWRDAVCTTLTEIAAAHDIGSAPLAHALSLGQSSLDWMLVSLGEAVESERRELDAELSSRDRELRFVSSHDPLTGLPNRTQILDRAAELLARRNPEPHNCAALLVDLDGFKAVNDGLGYGVGDQLLLAVAERIGALIAEADMLGRIGGDQFAILVDHPGAAGRAALLANRLQAALSDPFPLTDGRRGRVAISACIGIALGTELTAVELLRDADIAMYEAKLNGRGQVVCFRDGMQDAAHNRMTLEMSLRDAIGTDRFHLVYQPMLDLSTLQPVRMEALLRWRNDDDHTIPPDRFIPVLEDSGLIAEVGRWVLREACAACAEWVAEGLEVGVAVNVSALQFEHPGFIEDVAGALASSGLHPGLLTIEITETSLMRDADRTAEVLGLIKRLGVRLSIDDFGTGYSSLAYLQRFPVDELKIDRSFIAQIESASQRDALIRTFVELGRSLQIKTIAEGIEDHSQLERLRAERCDIGQGFLFARPMDAHECRAFIDGWLPDGAGDGDAVLAA